LEGAIFSVVVLITRVPLLFFVLRLEVS